MEYYYTQDGEDRGDPYPWTRSPSGPEASAGAEHQAERDRQLGPYRHGMYRLPTSRVRSRSPHAYSILYGHRDVPHAISNDQMPSVGSGGNGGNDAQLDQQKDLASSAGSNLGSSTGSCTSQSDYRDSDFHDDLSDEDIDMESPTELPPGKPNDSTDGSDNPENISCEFAGICHMDSGNESTHYRKIISHVFGRNKSATKVFPGNVWVHYCRKHYQRARYRAGQWPFTQCDLLLESLTRMKEWGGVESFQLILRRREQERIDGASHQESNDNNASQTSRNSSRSVSGSASSGLQRQVGRRNPRAVSAPVPDWLRERTGTGLSFDDIREIIHRVRQHMEELQRQGEEGSEEPENVESANNSRTRKKSRRVVPKRPARTPRSPIRFPDIEIIPTFTQWALEEHQIERKKKKEAEEEEQTQKNSSASTASSDASSYATTQLTDQPSQNGDSEESPVIAGLDAERQSRGSHRWPTSRTNKHGGVQKPRKRK